MSELPGLFASELIIKLDRRLLRNALLISLPALAGLFWLGDWDMKTTVTVWLFTPLVLYIIYRFFSSRPALSVDPGGIRMYSWLGLPTTVAWNEVDDIYTYQVWGERFLGIRLRDPLTMPEAHSALRRAMMRLGRVVGHAPVKLSAIFVPEDLDVIGHWILDRYGDRFQARAIEAAERRMSGSEPEDEQAEMSTLEIRPKKNRLVFWFVRTLGIGAILVGEGLTGAAFEASPTLTACGCVLLAVAIPSGYRLLRPRPLMTVGPGGITIAAWYLPPLRLHWDEIDSVVCCKSLVFQHVGINLRKLGAMPRSCSPFRRWLIEMTVGRAHLVIHESMLPVMAESVVEWINSQYGYCMPGKAETADASTVCPLRSWPRQP